MKTLYPCHIYGIRDAKEAYESFDGDLVRDYGEDVSLPDGTVLHSNYAWDDGGRRLIRCKDCGGLILIQSSFYENMFDGPDGYYKDWIPVASVEEADLLNILLGVMEMEDYPCRHIRRNNREYFWTKGEAPLPNDPEELRKQIREKYPLPGIDRLIAKKAEEE